MSFADLGVSRPVADALAKRGITAPFAVQKLVIEDVLDGHDVLVQSPTGSGKTLAFGVPLVDLIEADDRRPAALDPRADPRARRRRSSTSCATIAAARALTIAAVYGGVGIEKQAKRAARAHIVVATPGRLEDLLQRRAFNLEHVQILVIDEADRMLDMGFKPAVDRIVAQTPRDRQTLFFSATLEAAAGKLARAYTRDARRHVHEPESRGPRRRRAPLRPPRARRQGRRAGRRAARRRARPDAGLRPHQARRRPARQAARPAAASHAVAMHGNKSQGQRQRALAQLRRGRGRHPGRDRRRRARHRRRRRSPT